MMMIKVEHQLVFLTIVGQVLSFSHVDLSVKSRNVQQCNRIYKQGYSYAIDNKLSSITSINIRTQQGLHTSNHHQLKHSKTSLYMGLRSFLRRGKGGNDDKNGNSDQSEEHPEDIKAALEAIKADLEAVAQKEKDDELNKKLQNSIKGGGARASISSSATMSNSASTDEPKSRVKMAFKEMKKITSPAPSATPLSSTSSSRYGETVRDRVKRVKSGDMTEDEKLAFLNNALTPRAPPGKKGPRIRQAIPDPGEGRMSSSRSKSVSSSSSYRNDPLWNRVVGNAKAKDKKGMSRSRYNIEDVVGSDSAKKKYLDMVTDPNRFSSYAAMGGYQVRQEAKNNDDDIKGKDSTKIEDGISGGVFENLKNVFNNDKEDDDPDSLANRLQSAAIIKEKQDAEMKQKRDAERKAEKERIAEAQRQAAEEIRRREEAKIQRAKEQEERLIKEEQEKREAEENRKKAILAAQEEYWAKQLQKDKGKARAALSDEDKKRNLQQVTRALGQKVAIDRIRADQCNESEILQQAAEDDVHEREHNAELIETFAAKASNTVPQPILNDVSSGAFVKEQERKKAELDKLVEEQKARLATLNSPLPKAPDFTPIMSNNSSPVTPSPSVVPNSVGAGQNSLTPTQVPTPLPPRISQMPGLSLSELTMNAASKNKQVSQPPPSPAPQQPLTPSLSLREMTMLNNSKLKQKPVSTSSSERKGPIRQNIPIKDLMSQDDDGDDDDFFEYSRNGNNKNMSIKDIMAKNNDVSSSEDAKSAAKQKSKMWGIDIDKFDL